MKAVLAFLLLAVALWLPTAAAAPSGCAGDLSSMALDEQAPEVGAIRLHATNDDREEEILVCIYRDRDGLVYERVFDLPINGALDHTIPAPEGDYEVHYVMGTDRFSATGQYDVDLTACESKRAVVPVEVSHGLVGSSMGVYVAECEPPTDAPLEDGLLGGAGTARPLSQNGNIPNFTGTTNAGPEAGLAVVALAFLAFIAHKTTVPGLLTLYSRVAGPRLLDQRVRRDIVDLVTHEPGILLNEIAHRLELAQGSLRHHVRLLLAAGLLREARLGRQRHLFAGPAPGLESAIVLLRKDSARRLMDAIQEAPGQPLTRLARNARMSLSTASKVASRLIAAGLLWRDDATYPPRWYPIRQGALG